MAKRVEDTAVATSGDADAALAKADAQVGVGMDELTSEAEGLGKDVAIAVYVIHGGGKR